MSLYYISCRAFLVSTYCFPSSQQDSLDMKLFKDCWVALLDLFNALTLAPTDGSLQHSLQGFGNRPGHGRRPTAAPVPSESRNPVFTPPSRGESPASDIKCDYSAMGPGWGPCSKPTDRLCWLEGPNGQRFDVSTDYETRAPKGVLRKVCILLPYHMICWLTIFTTVLHRGSKQDYQCGWHPNGVWESVESYLPWSLDS